MPILHDTKNADMFFAYFFMRNANNMVSETFDELQKNIFSEF